MFFPQIVKYLVRNKETRPVVAAQAGGCKTGMWSIFGSGPGSGL